MSTPSRHDFLGALAKGPAFGLRLERTGAWLITSLELAGNSEQRRRGLLGRQSLSDGEGLVIAPSQGIHTFGMRFPIDVIGVARDGRVVKIRGAVPPRRLVFALRAAAMVELPAGTADRTGLAVGDTLAVAQQRQ